MLREMAESLDRDCPDCGNGEDARCLTELRQKVGQSIAVLMATCSRQGIDPGAMTEQLCEIKHGLERLQAEARDIEARLTAEATSEERKKWKEWVTEGAEKGAARAHAYTRLPTAWTPTTACLADGTLTSAVDALINEQRENSAACGNQLTNRFTMPGTRGMNSPESRSRGFERRQPLSRSAHRSLSMASTPE